MGWDYSILYKSIVYLNYNLGMYVQRPYYAVQFQIRLTKDMTLTVQYFNGAENKINNFSKWFINFN